MHHLFRQNRNTPLTLASQQAETTVQFGFRSAQVIQQTKYPLVKARVTNRYSCLQRLSCMMLALTTMTLTGCWKVQTIEKKAIEQANIDINSIKDNHQNVDNTLQVEFINDTKQKLANYFSWDINLSSWDINFNPMQLFSFSTTNKNEQSAPTDGQKTGQNVLAFINQEAGKSIDYKTDDWHNQSVKAVNINKMGNITSQFGAVTSIDENSLDFTNHPATKYRYMKNNAPYFDVIDSVDYLTISWYYASPEDNDKVKEISLSHAKRAYNIARQIMSDDGGEVVSQILSGETLAKQKVNNTTIEFAQCELYQCMLVLQKSIFAEIDAEYASITKDKLSDKADSDVPSNPSPSDITTQGNKTAKVDLQNTNSEVTTNTDSKTSTPDTPDIPATPDVSQKTTSKPESKQAETSKELKASKQPTVARTKPIKEDSGKQAVKKDAVKETKSSKSTQSDSQPKAKKDSKEDEVKKPTKPTTTKQSD